MENTITINFTEVKPVDLLGDEIHYPHLHEQICNTLFRHPSISIRVSDAVRSLFYGTPINADEQLLIELILVINQNILVPPVQIVLLKYLGEKLNNLKQQENEKEHEKSN